MKTCLGLALASLLLAGCTMAPPPPPNSPQANIVKDRAMTGQTE